MILEITLAVLYLAYGAGFALAINRSDHDRGQKMQLAAYILLFLTWPFWKGAVDGSTVNVHRELLRRTKS